MFGFSFIPDGTHIRFTQWRIPCIGASIVAGLISIALVVIVGLNFGIDFRGGVMMEVRTATNADIGKIRGIVGGLGLGDVAIQEFGAPQDVLIRVEGDRDAEDAGQAVVTQVREALSTQYGEEVSFRRTEVVGPKVSGELVNAGIIAVSLSVLAMLIYVWLRFEWQFGVGSVAALVHDVLLTMGLFVVTGLEFNLSIIAAILTIVGYSMNDTVVVFDRIRENLRKYKKMPIDELIDLSINETLSRTIMTSGTTLIALIALYVLGGEVIRGFTLAMIWGILVGTYSSIYVGAPLLIWLDVKRDWSGLAAKPAKGFGGAG